MTDESTPERPNPATTYKQIVGLAGKAARDLREWELARAEQLDGEIANAQAAVRAAAEREAETQQRANRWWRMAVDNVSRLSWLEAGAEPEPVGSARGARLDAYLEDVRPAYHELTQAILKLGWRAR